MVENGLAGHSQGMKSPAHPSFLNPTDESPQHEAPMKTFRTRTPAIQVTGIKMLCIGLTLALAVTVPVQVWALGPVAVDLGTAGRFLILSGAAITSTGGGIIDGDVGASPITGVAIGLDPLQVNGTIFAVDAFGPAGSIVNPGLLTQAKLDMSAAYTNAATRVPEPDGDFLNPGGGNLGGLTLVAGLYKFSSSALVTGSDLTLTGGPDDVWIFQIASDLTVGSGIKIMMDGGAKAGNVFWQVGSSATIGTSAEFKGTILADQSITMDTSSIIEGRALTSIAAITFNGQHISLPAGVGDYVWLDANLNGIQDIGETGLVGVVVNLFDSQSNVVDTTATDVAGFYSFTNAIPGDYFLEFVKPAGYPFTLMGLGGAQGSQADLLTGRTVMFTLYAGEFDPDWDAGLVSTNAALLVIKIAGGAADDAVHYVRAGSDVTYQFRVTNSGETFMTNVVVSDDVLGLIGTIPVLAPGATATLTAIHSNVLEDVVNVASVRGTPIYGNGDSIVGLADASTTDDADTRVDLLPIEPPQITKTASRDPAQAGQLLVYTITVFNASQSGIVSNVTVVETYAPHFIYKSSTPAPMPGTSNVWDLGDLPPGFTTNIVITGRVSKQASAANGLPNTVQVFSDSGTRTVSLTVRVVNDIPVPVTLLYFRAMAAPDGVRLKWETGTEFDNLGFNLYRSATASGSRTRVNAALIPGSASLDGAVYKFRDASARADGAYYYWLEEVAANFKTVTYGPAICLGAAGSSPAASRFVAGTFRTETAGGLYRIRYETLAASGMPLSTLVPSRLAVRIDGVLVPILVNAQGASLQPGDSILFYARKSMTGSACELAVEANPPRMAMADAHPVRTPGDVYVDQANKSFQVKFVTDPSWVRYFLVDFADAPVWVLDVTHPAQAILLTGYSTVSRDNGLMAVYLSYAPESGPARCLAVQEAGVIDVTHFIKSK
jgi:uncharacterized repeat protein (TIGR01451 family)